MPSKKLNSMTRSAAERGLPDDGARLELATTYLTIQTRLWPGLVKLQVLPKATPANAARLADAFRDRFLSDEPALPMATSTDNETGAAYLRYSCDNSSARSLDQQLKNVLERAASDRVFIPWRHVYADAAVTGTTANRIGYQAAKRILRDTGGPKRLYIDEIGRASRDAVEALRLGQLIDKGGKRLIGVTDGSTLLRRTPRCNCTCTPYFLSGSSISCGRSRIAARSTDSPAARTWD